MHLPKAILFDLDDTIISFEGMASEAWIECTQYFVQKYQTDFEAKDLFEKINTTRKWFWSDPDRHKNGRMDMIQARRKIVSIALENMGNFSAEQIIDLADRFSKLRKNMICLFPNSICTLNKLKEKDVQLALITNGTSQDQRDKIERFGLTQFFNVCLIEEEVGYGKPDIRIFKRALDDLKLSASDVWMVGDNLIWDVQAPQTIGIYSIWNDYQKIGIPKDSAVIPDKIIHEIAELLN
jgi:putative hydrolase of the HAD superfamily